MRFFPPIQLQLYFCFTYLLMCLTQVMYRTLNPRWNQTLEFPDDGSPLILNVKDHNAVLPTSSIGDCVVEYQRLPPNETSDKWIPLQGVRRGEIHVQITKRVPDLLKRPSMDSEPSLTRAHQISGQVKKKLNFNSKSKSIWKCWFSFHGLF